MSNPLFDLSLLPPQGTLVVGFSGGADSTALAHFLAENVPHERILLCHVNHMLRGAEADRDEAAVRAFARNRGLRLAVSQVDVAALAAQRGIGTEQCGREVRYAFFAQCSPNPDDRILTAHHRDDQAETVLLHLCRGAGLDGLCGMAQISGKLVRPLLHVSHEELEQYCRAHDLSYVQDSSNASSEYTRNFIRLQVLPILREINPQVSASIAQAAELLGEERAYLQQQADALLRAARHPYGLLVNVLLQAPAVLRDRAIKRYLQLAGCHDLERKHYEAVLSCLQNGGAVQLPHGFLVRRGQGVLSAYRSAQPLVGSVPLVPGENRLPNGKIICLEKKSASFIKQSKKIHNLYFKNLLDCATMVENPAARTRAAGERFAPAGRGCTKPLKQLFQDCGMPLQLRSGALILEQNGRPIWCEGVGPAEGYQVTEHTKEVLQITIYNLRRGTELW